MIDELTQILDNLSSRIDWLFTSRITHHQIIFAKFNLKIHYPKPYSWDVWDYRDPITDFITRAITEFNWERAFFNIDHCVKSVRIGSFPGPYFPPFGLNTGQKNFKYGHFSHSGRSWKRRTFYQDSAKYFLTKCSSQYRRTWQCSLILNRKPMSLRKNISNGQSLPYPIYFTLINVLNF